MVGGTQVVERKDGQTLRTEYATAIRSSPDALGLISWNEFSENSYVEPSEKYGNRYLDVLRELRQAPPPTPSLGADSSEDAQPYAGLPGGQWTNVLLLVGFVVLLVVGVGLFAALRRRRECRRATADTGSPP
jgi:LPXTG-motif cell wall-anchored protein